MILICILLIFTLGLIIYLGFKIKKLKQEVIQAKNKSDFKSKFLATMSHEIRTPLNGILVSAQLLETMEEGKTFEGSGANPFRTDLIRVIASSGQLLTGVVNDILDFSKIEAGQLNLDYSNISVVELLNQVTFPFQHQFESKGLYLYQSIDESVPQLIYSDEIRLKQVLTNLIGNALKFTSSGGVKVHIGGEKGLLHLSVADTGIGIRQERLDELFKEYTQAESSTFKEFGGTGLGLNISKKLVGMMGGDLKVKSELNRGSEFYFSLPLVEVSRPTQALKVEQDADIDLSNLKVLVADDMEVNRKVLELSLNKFGIEPDLAVDGQDTIDKIKQSGANYDILFLDLQMPRKDGIQVCEELIESIPYNELPLIYATSANVFKEVKDQCYNAGMSGFISKPLNIKNLKDPLTQALKRKK